MRKIIFTGFLFLHIIARSQQFVGSFTDAKANGTRISKLDSIYKNAIGSGVIVFKGQEEKFMAAYQKMLQDFGAYLKKNGFSFGQSTRSFTRIYFKADGSIDFFLYNFKPGVAPEDKIKAFDRLLKEFVKSYNIGMQGSENFVQCSPTVFS